MTLENLLQIINPVFEGCKKDEHISFEVNYISNDSNSSNATLKKIGFETSKSFDCFQVDFHFKGNRANLSLSHYFRLDLTAILILLVNKGDENINEESVAKKIVSLIKLIGVKEFIPLTSGVNGIDDNNNQIAQLLIDNKNQIILHNLNF